MKMTATITSGTFKHYDNPRQYAEAFQRMVDARERWQKKILSKDTTIK